MTYTINDGYIKLPIDINPSVIQANAFAAISKTLPGWIPRESHIEVLLLEQMAQMTSVSATVAAQVPLAIFSVYGSLVGIIPIQGQAATAQTLWTMTDTEGYTIPANTVLGYRVLGNATYQFTNTAQFTVSPGNIDTSVDYPNGILIKAQNVGSAYNNLPLIPPAPQNLYLITSLSYVNSITFLPGGTGGGVDPESTAAYLDRLSNELHYLTPRPILPGDFAGLSTNVAGVYRATAFNGLDPYGNILTPLEALFNSSVTWTVLPGSPCTLSAYTGGAAPPRYAYYRLRKWERSGSHSPQLVCFYPSLWVLSLPRCGIHCCRAVAERLGLSANPSPCKLLRRCWIFHGYGYLHFGCKCHRSYSQKYVLFCPLHGASRYLYGHP